MKATRTLTQIQQDAIDALLAIPAVSKRGSGHLQGRMRRRAMSHYRDAAIKLGYTDVQIADQFTQIREMVELEQGAQ